MEQKYVLQDVVKSYHWLGHKEGYTELNAFHPEYKQGRENFEWNKEHKTFPRIKYAKNESELINFVKRYAGTDMVCYGINPRPQIFMNDRGYPRATREEEIEVSQNLLFDFDFHSNKPVKEQIREFRLFLKNRAIPYLADLGIKPPTEAFTGRGYHLLFAYAPITVSDVPDISDRLKAFCEQFRQAHRQDLDRLEVKLDPTQDLRRMLKVYGTSKPEVGIVSRFYGGERIEDDGLREYLLHMNIEHPTSRLPVLNTGNELPLWFHQLLDKNASVRALWQGEGKPGDTDRTRSGYDYSLIKTLLYLGHDKISELATIVALRPAGAARDRINGDEYIRRTIANALLK